MVREKILQKLANVPGLPSATGKNIEISVYNHAIAYANRHNIEASWTNFVFKHVYVSKAQEVIGHLRESPEFTQKVVRDKLSTEIAEYHRNVARNRRAQEKETAQNNGATYDGIFKCRKCGSRRTTYYSVQIRSQDEPATNFITCLNCENRWKN